MKMIDVTADEKIIRQTAQVLCDGFKNSGVNCWTTLESATEEVHESLGEGRISRIAIDASENVLGWIGGISEYDGEVWELHPLVVHPAYRKQGIGRALVEDFERQVAFRGGATIRVGTDDEDNRTSLGGVDLYTDVLGHLSSIKNLREHPFEFYQKLGYVITGVVPDANGFGKPDILMAKRIVSSRAKT